MGWPQQRAEDFYMMQCFLYYVKNQPRMSDAEFDRMHRYFLGLYPDSAVLNWVGSDIYEHYPAYIQQHRRPLPHERRFPIL